jgi:hypothetical protein
LRDSERPRLGFRVRDGSIIWAEAGRKTPHAAVIVTSGSWAE